MVKSLCGIWPGPEKGSRAGTYDTLLSSRRIDPRPDELRSPHPDGNAPRFHISSRVGVRLPLLPLPCRERVGVRVETGDGTTIPVEAHYRVGAPPVGGGEPGLRGIVVMGSGI